MHFQRGCAMYVGFLGGAEIADVCFQRGCAICFGCRLYTSDAADEEAGVLLSVCCHSARLQSGRIGRFHGGSHD